MQAYLIGEASAPQIKVLETYGAGKTFMVWENIHSGEVLTVSDEELLKNSTHYATHKVKIIAESSLCPTESDLANPVFKRASYSHEYVVQFEDGCAMEYLIFKVQLLV